MAVAASKEAMERDSGFSAENSYSSPLTRVVPLRVSTAHRPQPADS